jgi:hypothetical protein
MTVMSFLIFSSHHHLHAVEGVDGPVLAMLDSGVTAASPAGGI